MAFFRKYLSVVVLFLSVSASLAYAQISQERFGKNRLQFEKKKWHYLKTNYFDVYYTDSLDRMAEFVGIKAEAYLPEVENEIGYTLPGRTEIVLYASFNDYLAANVGKNFMWQTSEGASATIHAKMVLYYNGYQQQLATQIRQGLIHYLFQYYEVKDLTGNPERDQANQAVPEWLMKGYIAYKAKSWSTSLDDRFRNLILHGEFSSFEHFYSKYPWLVSHAFWYYLELTHGKEAPTSFMTLLRSGARYKRAFQMFYEKSDKEVKQEFMEYMRDLYSQEEENRETSPEGDQLIYEVENDQRKFYNFIVHPNEDNSSRAYVKYEKGETKVMFVDEDGDETEILRLGYRNNRGLSFGDVPFLAWNNKGDQIAVAYPEEQKIKILLYNAEGKYKSRTFTLKKVEWVQSMKFDFKDDKLILSAFKNGQSDIFVYDLPTNKMTQITNDPYDDLDPSPLLFSNKTGIIYTSNRPLSGTTKDPPSRILTPSNYYNIFTVDAWLKEGFRTINKLTNISGADATSPIQYNSNYFTFLSDISGIRNRYLGRVLSTAQKPQKLFVVNGQSLLNPSSDELREALAKANKSQPDTSYEIGATQDSATMFPISNLSSSLYESRSSGLANKITEVFYDGVYKTAYVAPQEKGISTLNLGQIPYSRFKTNDWGLAISPIAFPTVYAPGVDTTTLGKVTFLVPDFPKLNFGSEWSGLKKDEGKLKESLYPYREELSGFQVFKYRFRRFYVSQDVSLQTGVFTDRLQPYGNGSGPIYANNGASGTLGSVTTFTDVSEDYEVFFGFDLNLTSLDLKNLFSNSQFSVGFNNYRRRLDWGVGYRLAQNQRQDVYSTIGIQLYQQGYPIPIHLLTHYLDLKLAYPLDALRSIRLTSQVRNETYVYVSNFGSGMQNTPDYPTNTKSRTAIISRLEWVYDHTFQRTINLPDGLKYKVYLDWIVPVQDNTDFAARGVNPNIFNLGTDIRYYYPVYKDLTLAARLGLDMSFGDRKIIYYVGGSDNWFLPSFSSLASPSRNVNYAYQALALNLRGYPQNGVNGSSAMTLNFEARIPTSTFTNRYVRSLFLRNLQLVMFTDLGMAWNDFANIGRPVYTVKSEETAITVTKTIGGIGPFIGGFGTGLRMRFLSQYLKFDIAWNYDDFFRVSPLFYFAIGMDF